MILPGNMMEFTRENGDFTKENCDFSHDLTIFYRAFQLWGIRHPGFFLSGGPHCLTQVALVGLLREGLPKRINQLANYHIFIYLSLDWFKGKSTGNHGFDHQI